MAKYRIYYTIHSPGTVFGSDSHVLVETVEAEDDGAAIRKYNAFKRKKEAENEKGGYWTYSFKGGLIRIDQEELTTRISI